MDVNSYPFNDPKSLPWNRGALADGWTIVGMNHYNAGGVRALFVAMTRGEQCVKAEGTDELKVWRELEQKAASATVTVQPARSGEPKRIERPADPLAKSVADLVTPKQLSMIRERARRLEETPGDLESANARADELALLELQCKTEELSKFAASYFIQRLDDFISDPTTIPVAKTADAPAAGKLRSVPATEEQKANITSRKEKLRRLRPFPDAELKRELAAVGCTVPKDITAIQATKLIARLDELVSAAEAKKA